MNYDLPNVKVNYLSQVDEQPVDFNLTQLAHEFDFNPKSEWYYTIEDQKLHKISSERPLSKEDEQAMAAENLIIRNSLIAPLVKDLRLWFLINYSLSFTLDTVLADPEKPFGDKLYTAILTKNGNPIEKDKSFGTTDLATSVNYFFTKLFAIADTQTCNTGRFKEKFNIIIPQHQVPFDIALKAKYRGYTKPSKGYYSSTSSGAIFIPFVESKGNYRIPAPKYTDIIDWLYETYKVLFTVVKLENSCNYEITQVFFNDKNDTLWASKVETDDVKTDLSNWINNFLDTTPALFSKEKFDELNSKCIDHRNFIEEEIKKINQPKVDKMVQELLKDNTWVQNGPGDNCKQNHLGDYYEQQLTVKQEEIQDLHNKEANAIEVFFEKELEPRNLRRELVYKTVEYYINDRGLFRTFDANLMVLFNEYVKDNLAFEVEMTNVGIEYKTTDIGKQTEIKVVNIKYKHEFGDLFENIILTF